MGGDLIALKVEEEAFAQALRAEPWREQPGCAVSFGDDGSSSLSADRADGPPSRGFPVWMPNFYWVNGAAVVVVFSLCAPAPDRVAA
ncbi:hypothetical protein [Phaeobacter sp. CECT 5382]|uniref:hypothetical protein n=1 Tax=Phaeobacter sp. CECT 5382 TaxID=1712645 RepID=UPI0018D2652D|nr:hypothetical protein [Phaeobacter sp. CECT 5382]